MDRLLALARGGSLPAELASPATLSQALARAASQKDKKGILYLQPDGREIFQSYADLCKEAELMLGGLYKLGLHAGDKVILQVEDNQDYLPLLWACFLGGLIAVPISIAPSYTQPNITTARLQRAWELCEHPLIVASSSLTSALYSLGAVLGMEQLWLESIDTLRASTPGDKQASWHEAEPDDVALILFTSGSTGVPKGAMLTHRNILSEARGFTSLEKLTSQEITFNWMPLDHIGGLVTFHLRDVFLGCQQIHTSPQTVLQAPLTWLDCLDRYHATCTWAPNFAFNMIVDSLHTRAEYTWDLSALHYILNAGEAIVPKTARRFLELLRPYGLASTAIHPSWGMSETSAGVTFSSQFSLESTTDEDRFVDVGALIPEVEVRIVDIHDQLLPEREVGRIQVQGSTVSPGYYRNTELNSQMFTADGWFDTGDLGILNDGRLTVTGRAKNIIIINGLNYYSHEIEAVVEEIHGVEVTFTAACAVRQGSSNTDALAIFYVTLLTREEEILAQIRQIRGRVIQAIGVNPAFLLPLEKQAVPKTETGKLRRNELRQLFEEGAFDADLERWTLLKNSQPRLGRRDEAESWTNTEKQLLALWQQLLPVTEFTPEDNFFELGGHSLTLMQLLSRVRELFYVDLSSRDIFEHPTVAALANKIDSLRAAGQKTSLPQLAPAERDKPLPLAFTQQRLWFLEKLRPGDTAYTSCSAFKLNGQFSLAVLERSLREIIHRHEILRTTFIEQDEQPTMLIHADMEIPLSFLELEHLSAEEQGQHACELIQQEIEQPFELNRGPLTRFLLLRLGKEEHIFVTVISHIISDGWSLGVFNRELALLYDAFKQEKPSPLPDLPLQFADYAAWQRAWLQGKALQQELVYWKDHLQGAPTLLELPTDHPRQPVQAGRVALHHFQISQQVTHQLNRLCQEENVTLFMALLAAFQVLLYRYTNQPDVVVGTVIANRTNKLLEPLIGFFANTLALRTTLSDALTFHEVLSKVRNNTIGAYTHSEAPFEQVVHSLRIEQNLSHAPLVQVAFFLQDEQMYQPHFQDLQVQPFPYIPFPFRSGVARFDLLLEMTATREGLLGSFEYESELFEKETIARLAGHWQTLLESIVANPHLPLPYLPLLTESERQQILIHWNATFKPRSETRCLPSFFEEQVQRTPLAPAVTFEGTRLTYDELNRRSNQLASYLQASGVGSEVLVGIFLERSLDMLVALLGVMKAGGAYVPLDPHLPSERLAFQLHDAQVSVLLTQDHLRTSLPALSVPIVSLDTQWPEIAQQSDTNLAHAVRPADLAYMIYTSGSTGRPKGVQVLHRGLINFLQSMQEQPGLQADDILLAITTISFDIAALELFLPLLVGAQVVIASQEVAADSTRLASLLTTSRATVMQATPAMWRLLLDGGWSGSPQLKALCGGEALPRELATLLLSRTRELWNLYGPTETTIWSTIERITTGDETITVGRPIANTQVYILDQHLQPVPAGITGELYIGGSGLARGYFQRPELTEERFIPDPFCQGQRLYLTGDLARYRPDGRIEYLGRNDFQVKVHGYRIELGEVEATLLEHPAITACAVTAVTTGHDNKQLAAYLIVRPGQAVGVEELRHFLQQKLPEYMLPAFFVSLEEFPLTPNGKVDRRALPAPEESRLALTQAYTAPQTPEEEVLAAIWAEVLHIGRVGIHDSFFALGGDSLLSMSVLSKAHKQGLEFTLQEFFQHPRIHDLAQVLRKILPDAKSEQESARELEGAKEIPLTAEQNWQLYELRNPHQFNFPILFITHEPLDLASLRHTIRYLVRHHDALRLRFHKEGSIWKQSQLDPDMEEIIPIEHIDLSELPEAEQLTRFKKLGAQSQATLNLTQGPISRVLYFDMGPNKPGRLLWFLNHIVCDRITSTILAEDFLSVYQQFAAGRLESPPQKTTSFRDWAACIGEYLHSPALQDELEHYWLKLPWQAVKPLPADFPEAASSDSFKASRQIRVSLDKDDTRLLFRRVLSADVQLLDVFLTVLSETFAHWTGSPYLPLYVSDHGREPFHNHADLIRTAGFLSWKRLCFLQWQEAEPWQALQAIKKQVEAIPNKGKGFELLYYAGEQKATLQALPVGEVLFNYIGQIPAPLPSSSIMSSSDEIIENGIDSNDRREPPTCIQVVGAYADDCLHLSWDYSENLYRSSTIEQLAQNGCQNLRKLIHALARR